ncbi:MAG: purine-nucleoside phosphorylase [Armatimonadota bacterium]|nr:purine-nucleoside phosphorylase [Armatimonadota bacterium]MDR7427126.1 purine-nucleoside phosphorylase [Armatimonadota bacterium]MDR7464207.1 purine-nucleoside phosphorylase [Armatimonadota bacterium]MDR7470004.1 purine-nucleoside phosphorylase [Armatimonadota bacterium]MDR7474106.1 purine-nucleoside phosphorylase [Armatimonadota bacterium]
MSDLRESPPWVPRVREAAAYVRERTRIQPRLAVVLGSGLGALADAVEREATIPYSEIPHFPVSTAAGHAGNLVLGLLEGKPAVIMQGRAHFYEGYSMGQVIFPVRVMRELGAGTLLVSNAAGGLNREWRAGDLMVITDHINFMGTNPLIGPHEEAFGARFPDMARPYDPELVRLAERVALEERILLRRGVYVAVSGPSYETAAELRMLARWGADAVGMSTVPEVIAARQMGMRVLGFSAITDMATGEVVEPVTHEAVLAVARELEPRFVRLVRRVVAELSL